jgi:hypothetical protein
MCRYQKSNFIERFPKRNRRQFNLVVLFVPIVLAASFGADAAELTFVDSIRVDGKLVRVDAQVQFDSLVSPIRGRDSRGINRQLLAAFSGGSTRVSLEMLAGMGRGPLEGLRWSEWTGQHDFAQSISLQQQLKVFKSNALRRNGWRASAEGQVLFIAQQLGGQDIQQIPDSVIGFISQGSDQDWSAVTYERYSNGIETDTITMVAGRDVVFASALQLGVGFIHRKGLSIQICGGAFLNWQKSSRLQLQSPEIDGVPWRLLPLDARRILPLMSIEVGQNCFELSGWQFSIQGSFKWMPESLQNCWLGFGVSAATKSSSRGNLAR